MIIALVILDAVKHLLIGYDAVAPDHQIILFKENINVLYKGVGVTVPVQVLIKLIHGIVIGMFHCLRKIFIGGDELGQIINLFKPVFNIDRALQKRTLRHLIILLPLTFEVSDSYADHENNRKHQDQAVGKNILIKNPFSIFCLMHRITLVQRRAFAIP